MSLTELMLAGAAIFFGALLQRTYGFAFVLVAMPLLSFFMDMKFLVPLIALFLTLISGIITFRYRVHFEFKKMVPLTAGAFVGIPVGIFGLLQLNNHMLKAILGMVLIIYSAYSLSAKSVRFRTPDWSGWLFGFLAGVLGGAFNTSGPPAVFHISGRQMTTMESVASLNFFIFCTSLLVLAYHIASGHITEKVCMAFIKLLPFMAAGMVVGGRFSAGLNQNRYRKGLFVLLIITGILLIA